MRPDEEPIGDIVYLWRDSMGLICGCETEGACKTTKYIKCYEVEDENCIEGNTLRRGK